MKENRKVYAENEVRRIKHNRNVFSRLIGICEIQALDWSLDKTNKDIDERIKELEKRQREDKQKIAHMPRQAQINVLKNILTLTEDIKKRC